MRERMRQRILKAQAEFELLDHTVILERIPVLAVREEVSRGRYRLYRERIVGINMDPDLRQAKIIKIVHTKPEPSLEDLRHEFCHFVNPDWSEEMVRTATSSFSRRKIAQ